MYTEAKVMIDDLKYVIKVVILHVNTAQEIVAPKVE